MSLQQGNLILSTDITNLKSRIKTEMARRSYSTPNALNSYASDFTAGINSANAGYKALLSHFNETVGYINYIAQTNIGSDKIYSLTDAETILSAAESVGIDDNQASCGNQCQGLCYDTCSNGCRGGCTGTCNTTCTANCQSDCSGGCSGGCNTTCSGSCSGGCGDDCHTNCHYGCDGSCWTACTGGCKSLCQDNCELNCVWSCEYTG